MPLQGAERLKFIHQQLNERLGLGVKLSKGMAQGQALAIGHHLSLLDPVQKGFKTLDHIQLVKSHRQVDPRIFIRKLEDEAGD